MSVNVRHYKLNEIDPELRKLAEDGKLTGPCFIGQGLSKRVGSDCYGFYITDRKRIKSKDIWGITSANQVMHTDWTEGTMDCSIDIDTAVPFEWITKYGKQWYFCNENGKRFNGMKCRYGWNGAYGYQDPSF